MAGEASGDNLGAPLIEALRARLPTRASRGRRSAHDRGGLRGLGARGKPRGHGTLRDHSASAAAVADAQRAASSECCRERPDVYVGIDAKEFNLRLAPKLKADGIRTVQYVSPQVWAWRQGRVRTIGRAVDLVLCLLPFEKQFYDGTRVRAVFVGHPLADQIPMHLDPIDARMALGLASDGNYMALLPGSRHGEVARLSPDFAATVALAAASSGPELRFVAAHGERIARRQVFDSALEGAGVRDRVTLVDGQAQEVMAASDVVLLASGTATLEATLVKRPMVVAYRLGALTSFLLKHLKLFKAPFFAQPNLLAGRQLVPEFFNRRSAG